MGGALRPSLFEGGNCEHSENCNLGFFLSCVRGYGPAHQERPEEPESLGHGVVLPEYGYPYSI